MRLGLTSSILLVSLAIACGPGEAGSGEEGTDSSSDSSSAPSTSDPPTSVSSDLTGIVDPETTGTSDGGDLTTTVTDGPIETTGDPETTGEPPACGELDPATNAGFKVVLAGWPDQSDDEHAIDSVCVVDAVAVLSGSVVTEVTCDVEGVPQAASLEIAAAPEGVVDWQAGESVALHSFVFSDDFGSERELHVTRADDPAALLIDGRDWWGDNVPQAQDIGPIHREIASSCMFEDEGKRFELLYSLESGATLGVRSGSRGSLVIDDSHVYAIDLAGSGEDCCHGSEHSLIRRVVSE